MDARRPQGAAKRAPRDPQVPPPYCWSPAAYAPLINSAPCWISIAKLWDNWSAFGGSECGILMVGLDAAGKTTILYKLKLGEVMTRILARSYTPHAHAL